MTLRALAVAAITFLFAVSGSAAAPPVLRDAAPCPGLAGFLLG